ncbi:UDP-glucose 4-epimerase GalE [Rhizobium leguminosarum]|jgi:UDP-arabinose 4-epimerase|uniref:UDP-glucose 4-epimerase n=1 Tax=Rhizobium leguminosarum bv. trifolii (strain WSM1325) TaxID=395491 RepID=C6B167_RHILS|nr:UDP-glucose 4-epimerase GalE [Rhizobium leguminosarum]ACS58571.1 UDP-glucose 4-epimerase [Rhizobium leguminosarum bv. trifolii WSM1325]MBY2912032.1 UDP-glucose 4-epimerase GalE [Rhizobium leguminosarum]MBY2919600.1 UDP-glucose 4-epimerase GalE [Rhizobium leguminosarum]MBY2926600.1 UDP-glucose 4-epimerase GalE [Rhizobium leguminosarum]MBY2932750.1 UDP-glucose 4-epimerase GalE [Rhizobium leguminosarum]
MPRYILVTGGAGFIGSHICKALSRAGMIPVTYDNLSTGHADSVRWGPLIRAELADAAALRRTLAEFSPDCVIHCGANAYVGESVDMPRKYYRNNVVGSLTLLEACLDQEIDRIVFSSSCATYGVPASLPIREESPQHPVNPYGRTKLIFEMALEDFAAAYGIRFAALRYFNAAGADPDGELAERHQPETHLIPRALLAAAGRLERLDIFGTDYATEDGTCVRDYIHVSDLAQAHLAAVNHLMADGGSLSVNLGSGRGTSVREILEAIRRASGREVPVRYRSRRAGDPPILFANTARAKAELGFAPAFSDIDTIIRTAGPTFGLEMRA